MTWIVLLAAVLAVVRATRLVTTDEVSAPARHALARRFPPRSGPQIRPETGEEIPTAVQLRPHWLLRLVYCDWCVSFWLSLLVALALHAAGLLDPWRWVVLAWWAIAGAAGLLLDRVP
jgi:hypothetical protein